MRKHSTTAFEKEQFKDTDKLAESPINPLKDAALLKEAITDPNQWRQPDEARCETSETLRSLLDIQEQLRAMKSTDIRFSPPILTREDAAVIFPNTINAIQGQTGTHKSRLAEVICSSLLMRHGCVNPLLNFKRRAFDAIHHVLYVDTERNLKEQLPAAIQSILIGAGYAKEDNPPAFDYISLLMEDRRNRFNALNEYFHHKRQSTDAPLFVVLDVTSDCVEDFNKVDKSMELIDMMNRSVNEHNVTFLCILHENPRSDKMRGHLGTELGNKASTTLQVAFEKDGNNNDTDILKVKFNKCRSTKRHQPFYVKYGQEERGLILAQTSEVSELFNSRKHKAPNEDIIDHIEMYLGDGSEMKRTDLLDKLCTDFQAKQRTIEERLKEIMEDESQLHNDKGLPCQLHKEKRSKEVFYQLRPTKGNENDSF